MNSSNGANAFPKQLKSELCELAEQIGVELEYVDGRGSAHQATDEMLRSSLGALGIAIHSEADIQRARDRLQREYWTRIIEPVVLHYPKIETSLCLPLVLPLGGYSLNSVVVECQLQDEHGKKRSKTIMGADCVPGEEKVLGRARYVRAQARFPFRLRLGYYDVVLTVRIGSHWTEGKSFLIVAPQRCYLPPNAKRTWGIGIQLYGIRSSENWGIGDFGDLERIIKIAGKKWRASTIGLQPLHSPIPGLRSPYSPSSRLCWNPLYLDLERVPEFRTSPTLQRMAKTKKFQSMLQAIRVTRLVEYEAVEELKHSVLEDCYRWFKRRHLSHDTARGQAFLRFVKQSPAFRERFCIFQALKEVFPGMVWREWPPQFHDPTSPAVAQFKKDGEDRVYYFFYVQWLCELQLGNLDHVAEKAFLSLGLYHDLPVGIHPDGADAWGFQKQLAMGVTIGAPPDAFNLQGQNWGLQAPNPLALRQYGYEFFRETLRQNMRHGGVLRIDHALGLFRMFWVPFGKTGRDGVYIKTFVDEMLAVLALESVRHKVMVVGEDLGTVTPVIQKKLERAGLLSYRLLLFERDQDGGFHLPQQFPPQALVSATTHDLPTLKGYWAGRDIEVKALAGLYPLPADRKREVQTRQKDRELLWSALRRAGFPLPTSMPETLSLEAIHQFYQFLSQTPSRLLLVQLEDLLGELDTPNLPGAADSVYPSWRMRLNQDMKCWLNHSDTLGFSKVLNRERKRRKVTGSSASRGRGLFENIAGCSLLRGRL